MKRIGIFGTSGMAREVGDIASEVGFLPIYIAHNHIELESWKFSDEVILEADVLRYSDMPFVVGIGENQTRQRLANYFAGHLRFSNLIHPSATFGRGQRDSVELSQGVIVCAGVRFTNNIQVGNFIIFNQNVTIAHDVKVEDFVHLAPGSIISGNVHIGQRCWIGAGAVVNQGSSTHKLHISNDTLIGSGAVVLNSCESNSIYVGIPAKRIK